MRGGQSPTQRSHIDTNTKQATQPEPPYRDLWRSMTSIGRAVSSVRSLNLIGQSRKHLTKLQDNEDRREANT